MGVILFMIENIKKSYPIVLPVEPVFFSNANDFYQNRLKYQQNRTTVIVDNTTTTNAPPADSGLGLQSMISPSSDIILHDDDNQPLSDINMSPSTTSSSNSSDPIPSLHVSNTFISSAPVNNNNNTNYTTCSEITPDVSPLLLDHSITSKCIII